MSQITRCPNCATAFKVVADQLRIAQGWVCCGQCKQVFDASAYLQPAVVAAAQPSTAAVMPHPPPPPPPQTGAPIAARRDAAAGARHGAETRDCDGTATGGCCGATTNGGHGVATGGGTSFAQAREDCAPVACAPHGACQSQVRCALGPETGRCPVAAADQKACRVGIGAR